MQTLAAPGWTYRKGLHDLGNGAWAYLQPDGSWGWSNAGLVVDVVGELQERLVIDDAFVERPRVLGESERAVVPDPLREVGGVIVWVRDRHHRLLRIDAQRGEVEQYISNVGFELASQSP